MKVKVKVKRASLKELREGLSVFGFGSIQVKPIGNPSLDGGEWEVIDHCGPRPKEQITDLLKRCADVESIEIDGVKV